MSGMGSRPGETNLIQPRGQGALPSGMAMQPWWTGSGLGAVSPAVVAPGISLSINPLGSGAAKGAQGKAVDDARAESSEDSRRSGEPRGLFCFTVLFTLVFAINLFELQRAPSSDLFP
jgi:nuclear transcription factor Y alpha